MIDASPIHDDDLTSSSFDIMTFNIRFGTAWDGPNNWRYRRDLLVSVINSHRPDILCLQEAMQFQVDYIVHNTDQQRYISHGISRNGGGDGSLDDESTRILLDEAKFTVEREETYWLSDTPLIPGSKSYGNSIPRIATQLSLVHRDSGKRIILANTHLDHESHEARIKGANQIIRHVLNNQTHNRYLIVGDFNNDSNDAMEIRNMYQAGFTDSHSELHGGDMPATFHDFTGNAENVWPPKIDFIWRKGALKSISSNVIRSKDTRTGRYPSDHFPIQAKIVLL